MIFKCWCSVLLYNVIESIASKVINFIGQETFSFFYLRMICNFTETATVAKEKQRSDWPGPSSLPTFDHIICHPYLKHWSEPARGHALTQSMREHILLLWKTTKGCFSLHFFHFYMVWFQILYLTPTSVSLCLDVNGVFQSSQLRGYGMSSATFHSTIIRKCFCRPPGRRQAPDKPETSLQHVRREFCFG